METLSTLRYVPIFDFSDFSTCEHCIYGKHTQAAHVKQLPRHKEPLGLVHSDVCGPMPYSSFGGASYFVTFIDDATRKVWVFPIKRKSDVLDTFKVFVALVENQSERKLKCLRTDNGGEYISKAFELFCDERGIKRELTAPYNPSQNGVAERMNRTILEKVRSMLSNSGLAQGYWAEAVKTAVHIINRSPMKSLGGRVPEEAWTGKQPSYSHLRVFGCKAYVHIPKELRKKLDFKSSLCIFLGYGESGEMGYRLWDPQERRIIRSNDVIFLEDQAHPNITKTLEVRKVIFHDDVQPANRPNIAAGNAGIPAQQGGNGIPPAQEFGQQALEDLEQQQPADFPEFEPPNQADLQQHWVRRSTRPTQPPQRFVPGTNLVMLTDGGEPSCFQEVLEREDHLKWELAMHSEMESLRKNATWDLVPLPPGKKALPCKWVFKLKSSPNSATPKYKARLVAKGFKQEKGVDFDEIFAPVVKLTTLRSVLALVAHEDLELVQMDVKTAFLHGDLHEEIYMQQPEGFIDADHESYACKLKKSLYGLKQAPREWYQKFDTFMTSNGFNRSSCDHCLYTKKAADGSLIILVLYVDDMLIAGKSSKELDALKVQLHSSFDMKDLGAASNILGMRITRDRQKKILFLSQAEYIKKVLARFNMEGGKPISTPLPSYTKLSQEDSPKSEEERAAMVRVPYASAVGSLMYAMVATRPDIAFAVGVVSRFMANPGRKHWEAVKGILRYLKGTPDVQICYGQKDASVHGFSDADFAGNSDNRKSTTGYVFTLTGGAVSWISRLQRCTALSTTEAEYIAAAEACKEAVWLRRLLGDLGVGDKVPLLYCDSQSAIQLARNPVFHSKTKHIEVKYHFIREVVENKQLELVKVPSEENPADILTKSIPSASFVHCRVLMGLS